jgi:hypothetical protein
MALGKLTLGRLGSLGGAKASAPALPSGALGIWQPATSYVAATKTIPNLAVNGPADQNLLVAPRRQFASTFYWSKGSATVTDLATTAPDGSSEATTFVGTASATWFLGPTGLTGAGPAVVQNGLTYTLAISVKDLSGGVTPTFKFGDQNTGMTIFTASASWQRFTKTFVSTGNMNAQLFSPDGVQSGNFAICDFQLFAGPADLNTNAMSAKPASIVNHDIVLHRDASTVSGGKITHGSQGLAQFDSARTAGPFTLLAVAQRVSGGLAPGYGGWAPIISTMKSPGDAYTTFSVGMQLNGRVGTLLSNTVLDAVKAYGSGGLSAQIQLSDYIFGGGGSGPVVATFRYDGTTANFFINGMKIGDNAVTVAAQSYLDLMIADLGNQGQNFTTAYDYYEIDLWGRALSDAEVNTATLSAQVRTALGAIKYVAFVGSSITNGVGYNSFASQVLPNLTPNFCSTNFGVASSTLSDLTLEASIVDALLTTNSGVLAHGKNILCVDVGSNDIFFNSWGTVSAFQSALQTYLTARRAAGWKIVLNTILSRGDTGTPGTFDADRATCNTAYRSWVGTYVDAVADWASDATMGVNGAWSNATNFAADHVHPTTAGHTLLEPYHRAAINSL